MPFPSDVITRPVSVGGAMVLESAGMLSLRVVVRASKSLVRDATGYRFEKLGVTSQGGPGGEVIINLPVTDQAGWKDPNLNALIDVSAPNSYTHQYTAQVDFTDADGNLVGISSIELGPFVVPTGDTVIDLDKNVPASTIAGGAVSIPDIWGQKIAEAEAVAAELQAIIPTTSAAVAAAVTTDGPAKQALNTTIGAVVGTAVPTSPRTVLGPRTVFDGDSITIAAVVSGTVGQDLGTAWVNACVRASNGRIRLLFNAGLAGQTAAGALSRFDTYVAPYAPQTVILTIGTNDDEQARSIAAYLADVEAYWQKCLAIGAKLVLGAIYPTSYNTPAGRPAASRARNVALYEWARTHDVFVIPFDKLADPVTGGWPAGWSGDLIHPGSDSDWYSNTVIGEFAWSHLANMYGGVAVKEATVNGADSAVNGFFTTLATAIAAPSPTIANDTASGSLPAGTYQYVVTTVDYFGQSVPSNVLSTTLSATGKVTITVPAVSGNQGYRVYRKVGSDYLLLGRFAGGTGTVTIVDDGSVTPAGVLPSANLAQVRPSGVTIGSTKPYRPGQAGAFADPAFRGNSLRISPYDDNTQSSVTVATATIAPGEVWEVACRVKDYGAAGQLYIRVKASSGGSTIQTVQLARGRMPLNGGLVHYRFTVPAGATYAEVLAIGLPVTDGKFWALGELRLQKVA